VILAVATSILIAGIASVVVRGPLRPEESEAVADPHAVDPIAAALGADRPTWYEVEAKGPSPREPSSAPGSDAVDDTVDKD
jgi:hypothetical protein